MIQLRAYQMDGVAEIRAHFAAGRRRVVYVLPTGGGKTVVFSHIAAAVMSRKKSVLLLGHRGEIVRQISGALHALGVEHGVLAVGHPVRRASVQVASVGKFARRLPSDMQRFDLIVVDECHHVVAKSWQKILVASPNAYVLGVTATPKRLDGHGLSSTFGAMVQGPSASQLTAGGYLSPFTIYAPPAPLDLSDVEIRAGDYQTRGLARVMSADMIIGTAADHWERICPGVPTVAFCVDRAHSLLVAEHFRSRGRRALHIDGQTKASVRRAAIAALGTGEIEVLCNCGLISEGVDVPSIGAAILLRPTMSDAMYLQQVGRALRVSPGKERAHILDFAGNVWRHGAPDEPRAWTLDAKPTKGRAYAQKQLRHCPTCYALSPRKVLECVACGAGLLLTPAERAELRSELVRAKRATLLGELRELPWSEQLGWAGADPKRLSLVAAARGYKDGWIYFRQLAVTGTPAR